jgi:phage terminase large subunit-like protein
MTSAPVSLRSSLRSLTPAQREAFVASLTEDEATVLKYDWSVWARDKQLLPEGDWRIWLALPGRGWGKTRAGAENIRTLIETGRARRVAIVNDTAADVRDVNIEGPDGLIAVSPPWLKPVYEPSKRRLTWPNGAIGICYAAEAPELLRGPQHDAAWCDELAKWKNLKKVDNEGGTAWDNLMMGLRVGDNPRCLVTTTPRAVPLIRELLRRPTCYVVRGSSYENQANLAGQWFDEVIRPYEGTRLGRQEVYGELLDDVPGALWTREQIEQCRVQRRDSLRRIVVAIDPATKSKETSDETGIVVAGVGFNGHGYVLEDASGRYSPDAWARKAIELYRKYEADRIVAEENQGGDMVQHTLRTVDKLVSYRGVHAAKAKVARAEPVAALYEQGRAHHVGSFPGLEDQMCTWDASTGEGSPDRVDALVWALTDLLLKKDAVAGTARWGLD